VPESQTLMQIYFKFARNEQYTRLNQHDNYKRLFSSSSPQTIIMSINKGAKADTNAGAMTVTGAPPVRPWAACPQRR